MGSGFRTFQSGEVLTSSNVQNYLMDQAITVFSGTAARGSAIASPETGMVSYRTDGTADSKREGFEFYDGASWTRLVPATTTAGLELISSTTIGSAVSSVTVSNVFSSSYDNYKILIVSGAASTNLGLRLTLGATATGYYWAYTGTTYANVAQKNAAANGTYWVISDTTATSFGANIDLIGPNLTENTFYYNAFIDNSTSGAAGVLNGFLNDTTAYTAFTVTCSTGNITGGSIRVYGYRN